MTNTHPDYPYSPTMQNTWLMESAKALHNTLPPAASDHISIQDVIHQLGKSILMPSKNPEDDVDMEQILKIQAQIINGIFTKTILHAQELERNDDSPDVSQDALSYALAVQSQFCRTAKTMNELKMARVHIKNATQREINNLQNMKDHPLVEKMKDLLIKAESKLINMQEAIEKQDEKPE